MDVDGDAVASVGDRGLLFCFRPDWGARVTYIPMGNGFSGFKRDSIRFGWQTMNADDRRRDGDS